MALDRGAVGRPVTDEAITAQWFSQDVFASAPPLADAMPQDPAQHPAGAACLLPAVSIMLCGAAAVKRPGDFGVATEAGQCCPTMICIVGAPLNDKLYYRPAAPHRRARYARLSQQCPVRSLLPAPLQ